MANVVEVILRGTDAMSAPLGKASGALTAFLGPAGLAITAATALAAVSASMAAAVGAAFFSVGKEFVNSADNLNNLHEKTGVAVEALSRLGFVAEEENTSLEVLSKGLKHAAGEAAKAGQDFETFLISKADDFARFADGPAKAAEAVRLFGKEGQALIPILNKGSDGLREALKSAEEFTTIIDGDTARAADELNDSLGRTWSLLKKGITDAIKPMLPELVALAHAFIEFLKSQNSFSDVWEFVAERLKEIIHLVRAAMLAWIGLVEIVASVGAAARLALENDFNGAAEALSAIGDEAEETWKKILAVFEKPVEINIGKTGGKEKPQMELINPDDVLRALSMLEEMELALKSGREKVLADIEQHYQKRLDIIEKFQIAAEDKNNLLHEAEKIKTKELLDAYQEGALAKAEIDEAYRLGRFERLQQALESENGEVLRSIEAQRDLMQTYQQLWEKSFFNISAAFKKYASQQLIQFSQGFGNAIGSIASGAQKAGEAFKALGKQMVASLASFLAQMVINTAITAALGKGSAKATLALLAPIASASGAAATAMSIATLGTALNVVPPTLLAIGSGAAFTAAFAGVGGAAHGGLDYVPSESTFLLQRGERVIQPQANEDLTEYLASRDGGGSGRGQPIHIQIGDEVIYSGLYRASRDGRMVIDKRAVV